MARLTAKTALDGVFAAQHVTRIVQHYTNAVTDFQAGEWEDALGRVGKFVEAVLKALWVHVGNTPPKGRRFKADPIITGLAQIPDGQQHDSVRLLIPRACRFLYDIASNRGGRHDSDELDPNVMDANGALTVCSWVLAELIRYAQKGAVDTAAAKGLVDSLMERKYPFVEEIEGRLYFHLKKRSATDVALAALDYRYPRRMTKVELIETIRRNGFSVGNARMAVQRIKKFVDDDGNGELRLLLTGVRRAEEVMKAQAPSKL